MARIYGLSGPEPGDQLVFEVLHTLPDDWIIYAQPCLVHGSEVRNPDYALLHREVGLIILEVKDWLSITDCDSRTATIAHRDGSQTTETSPIKQAETAAWVIVNRLKADAALTDYAGRLRFPYRAAGALPHQPQHVIKQLSQSWGANRLLGRDDLRADLIEAALRNLYAPFHEEMSEEQIRAVAAIIDGKLKIVDPHTRAFKGVFDSKQERLIKEAPQPQSAPASKPAPTQLDLGAMLQPETRLQRLEDDMPTEMRGLKAAAHVRLVRGFAGTGKTDILLLRAAYLKELYPQLDILVTTFNDPLFQQRLQPELAALTPDVDVIKFDTICAGIYQDQFGRWSKPQDTGGLVLHLAADDDRFAVFGPEFLTEEFIWMKETGRTQRESYVNGSRSGRSGMDGRRLGRSQKGALFDLFEVYQARLQEMSAYDWVDLHIKALDYLIRGGAPAKLYDLILVDEAQHFAPDWMAIVQQLLKPDGTLFLCDDPSQSVYRAYSWREKGVDVVGRTRWLRTPYRCTRQIFSAAWHMIADNPLAQRLLAESGEAAVPDLDNAALRNGPAPEIRKFDNVAAERDYVLQEIERLVAEEGLRPEDIGILHDKHYVLERYRGRVPEGVQIYEVKRQTGLEYRAVFIPQVQKLVEGGEVGNWEEHKARQCIQMYAAMTRARSRLYMLYEGKWPKELEGVVGGTGFKAGRKVV